MMRDEPMKVAIGKWFVQCLSWNEQFKLQRLWYIGLRTDFSLYSYDGGGDIGDNPCLILKTIITLKSNVPKPKSIPF